MRWRDIPGYEGAYQVNDQGQVRSLDRLVSQGNRWGSISTRFAKGQLLALSLDSSGYLQVKLAGKRWLVHQLVIKVFGRPKPANHEVDHLNGVRIDNRIDNLIWRTRRDQNRNRHHVRNRTGYIGVSKNPIDGPNPFWASARNAQGKKVFLGMHPTTEAASAAYLNYRETQFSNA